MAAVQNDGSAIQYISNPYEAVKMAAVKNDGLAIVIRLVFVLFAQLFILLIHILTLFAKIV